MHVFLVQKVGPAAWIVLAHGHVDGDAAGKFVRSLVTSPDISAECEQGWSQWRWTLRQRDGKWQVNKLNIYASDH